MKIILASVSLNELLIAKNNILECFAKRKNVQAQFAFKIKTESRLRTVLSAQDMVLISFYLNYNYFF